MMCVCLFVCVNEWVCTVRARSGLKVVVKIGHTCMLCLVNWSWLSCPDDKSTIVCTVHGSHPSFIVCNIVYVHLCGCCLLLSLLLQINQNELVSSHGHCRLVHNIMELLTCEFGDIKLDVARRWGRGEDG